MRQCQYCNAIVKGRADKKFCSKTCNNKFHAAHKKADNLEEIAAVNRILRRNREILVRLFEGEKKQKMKVSKLVLSQLGFNFKYITGIYYNREGKRYHYVYDLAWMEFSDQDILIINRKK